MIFFSASRIFFIVLLWTAKQLPCYLLETQDTHWFAFLSFQSREGVHLIAPLWISVMCPTAPEDKEAKTIHTHTHTHTHTYTATGCMIQSVYNILLFPGFRGLNSGSFRQQALMQTLFYDHIQYFDHLLTPVFINSWLELLIAVIYFGETGAFNICNHSFCTR